MFLCFIKVVANDDFKWPWVTFDLSNYCNMQPSVYIYLPFGDFIDKNHYIIKIYIFNI